MVHAKRIVIRRVPMRRDGAAPGGARAQHAQLDPHRQRGQRSSGKLRTRAVPGVVRDAQDERVALRRVRVAGQHVLQRRDELVAVARHHRVVVVRCRGPRRAHLTPSSKSQGLVNSLCPPHAQRCTELGLHRAAAHAAELGSWRGGAGGGAGYLWSP